jgi:hypothetical protein
MMKKLLCSILFTVLAVGFVQAQLVSGGASPGTNITTASTSATTNTPNTTDGTIFDSVTVGNSSSQTFTFTSNSTDAFFVGIGTIVGVDPSEFNNDAPIPSSISGIGATSTFVVNFEPTSSGPKSAIIEVRVTSQTTFITDSYFFEIQGTASAATPNISVTGDNGMSLIHPDLGPVDGDDNYYGDVVVGQTVTRQFTIENTGNAILTLTNIDDIVFSEADFDIVLPPGIVLPPVAPSTGVELNPNESFTFSIEFTPSTINSINEIIRIFSDDPDTGVFVFEVLGIGIAPSPDMDVFGNGILITGDDTNVPNAGNFTLFDDTDIATVGGSTRTFTIENNGTANLNLTSLSPIVDVTGPDSGYFTVTTNPTTPILPGGTASTFIVTFNPSAVVGVTTGLKNATIEISNNGVDNPYIYDIQGTATDATVGGFNQLMITQYYDGINAFDNWIEVKNISSTATTPGAYNIAVFLDGKAVAGDIEIATPDFFESIDVSLLPGEIIVYTRGGGVPSAIGTTNVVTTEVCSFTGNDVIVISTTTGSDCYNNRRDVIGEVGAVSPEDWGVDISFVKGCGNDNLPAILYDPTNIEFDPNQFIELSLTEVNEATVGMNIAIGTHVFGNTTWTGTWSNGTADKTREVIIDAPYTNSNGSLSACDLTVNSAITMDTDGAGSNYVLVARELDINGSMTIGDTEALVMTAGATVIGGQITKIEKSTPVASNTDYTYWSSPVDSPTNIETVFTGVNSARMFSWITPGTNATFPDGNWTAAAGSSMNPGRGYLVEAPTGIVANEQHEVTFSGTPNNGNVNVPVGINLASSFTDNGWNIIGNPYPSAIDIDLFLQSQQNLELNGGVIGLTDATVWLWTHNTPPNAATGEFEAADYATYNLVGGVGSGSNASVTNIIGSAQGFLVRVISESGNSVRFTNDMRVTGQNDTQFFKSKNNKSTNQKDRVWLNMTSEEGAFNQLLVGFVDGATDGYDIGYDGYKVGAANIAFYSLLEDGTNLAIQGFGAFNASKTIPLGFYSFIDATLKISIDNIEGILTDEDMYLVDNELNIVHNLKESDYEFVATSDDFSNERFVLKFNSGVLSTDDVILNNNFVVYNQDATLKIKAGVEISRLKVYDVTGRLLSDSEPRATAFDVPVQNIKAGTVLILNATMKDGSTISKKAIKF